MQWARIAASAVAIGAITGGYSRFVPANPTTVALTYLVAILLIATGWGIAEATTASLVAVFCFNFFFLPPVGTLTIADPQNWVALMAFLITAIVASQLSGRARERHIEALARQRDLERLYALSRALLLSATGASVPADIARQIAAIFESPAVALYDRQSGTISRGGPMDLPEIDARLHDVARQSVSFHDPSGLVVVAVRLGAEPIGSLAIVGAELNDTVLQSIANLAAIALERARGQEITARAEAARQSGELRATLLDAVAHEFKTPLTSIRAAASDLLLSATADARERELAQIIDEESNRLQGLVTDAVHMLRIEAGEFAVYRERHNLANLVASTLHDYAGPLEGHTVANNVPRDLTIDADRELLRLALRQLLNNAVKYSPPTSTIQIDATANSATEIIVRNSGSVIPEHEHRRIFDRFYRGTGAPSVPGTGMGLAIVEQIARAHGGGVTVASDPVAGTEFRLSVSSGELKS
jgi:two-component system sensor histidine kinase KdpD